MPLALWIGGSALSVAAAAWFTKEAAEEVPAAVNKSIPSVLVMTAAGVALLLAFGWATRR